MYKAGVYLLLPLLLINITTSANNWGLFGIRIGQTLYWIIIGLAWYVASCSPYRRLVTVALLLGILLRALEEFGGGELIHGLRIAALAIIFVVAGAEVYGKNALLLHKQLVIFLALCIPIMLLQILGVSTFFMGWYTEYAYDLDWVGIFKEINLYPTLFVGLDEIQYFPGQGRPVGLLYANNVLSVFVSIAVGINLTVARSERLGFSDIVVLAAVVLTMAKATYIITVLLYVICLVFNVQGKRFLCFKSLMLLSVLLALYYFFFPGLFRANISKEMFWASFLARFLDIANFSGIESLNNLFYEYQQLYGMSFKEDETYSGLSILLKSNVIAPVLCFVVVIFVQYAYRLRQMGTLPITPYVVTLIVCVLIQFGTGYFGAISFQFMAGFALFPLFKDLWHSSSDDMRILNRQRPKIRRSYI